MNSVCEVVAGAGSVARRADSMLWASDQTSEVVWDTLMTCLALGASARGAGSLLHALAETLPPDLSADAAFAVVVTDGSAGFVLRHGQVDVTLDGQPLQGGPVVPVSVGGRTVVAGNPDSIGSLGNQGPAGRHDLRDGAVAGGGFRWSSSPDLAEVGATAPPVEATADSSPGHPTAMEQPGNTEGPPEATSDPEQTEFHPPPHTDATSGPSLPPSAGVLVFEDGATANLTGDVVLGRRPEKHALVESGQAQPLVIHDPEHVLSSAHAAVHIQGDDVSVVDLDSLNGTHVAAPDARDWTKLTAGAPYVMQDGCRMLLGWTVLTYHSSQA